MTPSDSLLDGPSAAVESIIGGDCTADPDGNGTVELSDLEALLANYGSGGADCARGDIDG